LKTELAPGGKWDACAFVDAAASSHRGTEEQRALLREVQRLEFTVLLDRLTSAAA
jgi:hypothetical protein